MLQVIAQKIITCHQDGDTKKAEEDLYIYRFFVTLRFQM